MANTPLRHVLELAGSTSRYYMPIPADLGDGTLIDYMRRSREGLGISLPEKTPALADDPFYPEIKKAAEWLCSLKPGTALINGDYDVDGCTSTVTAWKMLRALGWSVRLFTPDRIEDHYGVNIEVLKEQMGQEKVDLVMTVDCGSASLEKLDALAKEYDLQTLVVDHHERLNAPASTTTQEINPQKNPEILKKLGTSNPYCAAVLTYMLASHVADIKPEVKRHLHEARILAGMAAIADVANMRAPGTRHCGVHFLEQACEPGTNPGLGVLMKKLRVTTATLDTSTASFQVIPVLNAANRMANANMVIDLFAYPDEEKLNGICDDLIKFNEARKVSQAKIESEALAMVTARGTHMNRLSCLLEYSDNWGIGVLGSAAGRIAQNHQLVTMLGGRHPRTGEIVFSARVPTGSEVDALHIFSDAVASLPLNDQKKIQFGGHGAAFGARLLDPLATPLLDRIRHHMDMSLANSNVRKPAAKLIDGKLGTQVDPKTLQSLRPLEPYGEGNPEPRFLIENVRISLRPSMKNPDVYRGVALDKDLGRINVLAFSSPNVLAANHSTVTLVGRLMPDKFAKDGSSPLMMKVEDVLAVDDPMYKLQPQDMPQASFGR